MANEALSGITETTSVANADEFYLLQGGNSRRVSYETLKGDLTGEVVVDATGATDVTAAIQAALDTVNSAGGGRVYLPNGIYRCDNVLAVGSNTHFYGDGFSTIFRAPAGARAGKTLSGVSVQAGIAMVGVTNSKVSNLTLDHATNATDSNGIQIGESGASVRSTDCQVVDCQVLGADTHQYCIYNKVADRTKILRNRVIGHTTTPVTDLAGIEVFGGEDVEVAGNDVIRCLIGIMGQQVTAVTDSDLYGLNVHHNNVRDCHEGLTIISQSGRVNRRSIFSNNIVTNTANRALNIALSATGTLEDLICANNVLIDATNCISADASGATPTGIKRCVIKGNITSNSGAGKASVYLSGANNIDFGDNLFAGTPENNFVTGGATSEINSNADAFVGATADAISLQGTTAGVTFTRHRIENYGAAAIVGTSSVNDIKMYNGYIERASGNTNDTVANLSACAKCEILGNEFGWDIDADPYSLSSTSLADGGANVDVSVVALDDMPIPGAEFFRLVGATAPYTITGFANGKFRRRITLLNNTGHVCNIAHNSGSSSAGNKVFAGQTGGAAAQIPSYGCAVLFYSVADSAWMFLGASG